MKSLRTMFERLDEDGSGQVDREEILSASDEDKILLNEFMTLQDPIEIFNQLDIDGGGSLDIEEFCEGLYQAAISKTPIELKRMDKRMDAIRRQLHALETLQEQSQVTMEAIQTKLNL